MSGFLDDHDDFEIARRLRRVAGPTPDVYSAYDDVVSRVGTVRRRRRLAVTSTAAVALLFAATSYGLSLRTNDRKVVATAPSSTEPSTATTEAVELGTSTIASETTVVDGWNGLPQVDPSGDPLSVDTATDRTDPPETDPVDTAAPSTDDDGITETSQPESTATEPSTAPTTPAQQPAGATPGAGSQAPVATTPTTTTTKPKPKPTPTTQPAPATVPETTAPPVETTVPPTAPPTTVPETTTPPTTVPPPPTQPPVTEPTVPLPAITRSWSSPNGTGNAITVSYQNGQLWWITAQTGDGWTVVTDTLDKRKLRAEFTAADGVTKEIVVVTVVDNEPAFS